MTNKEINDAIELLYALANELRSDVCAIHTLLSISDRATIEGIRSFVKDCRLNRSSPPTLDIKAQRHMIRLVDRQRRRFGHTHQPRDKVMAVFGGPREPAPRDIVDAPGTLHPAHTKARATGVLDGTVRSPYRARRPPDRGSTG